jgi:hypothetical protein
MVALSGVERLSVQHFSLLRDATSLPLLGNRGQGRTPTTRPAPVWGSPTCILITNPALYAFTRPTCIAPTNSQHGDELDYIHTAVRDVAVRIATCEMAASNAHRQTFPSMTPGYAWLAGCSPRSPGAKQMSPRCGWTIRLDDWLDVEDYVFENPDGSHFKIGCGSKTPSAILQLYSPGSQTRNHEMHRSRRSGRAC